MLFQLKIILFILAFLYGAIIGSFLNVCICRIPNKESIVRTRSHCVACGKAIKWYDLIPLYSYIQLGGRCRNCKQKISIQYPMVELVNGLAYVLVFIVNGFNLVSVLYCLCFSALLALSVIDLRTQEIPFGFNVFIFILGLIRMGLDLTNWANYVIGFFSVSSFLFLILLVTKGRGMGGGDVKLMAAAGLLLGWKNIVLSLMIGSLLGSIIHLVLMRVGGKDRVLAFGPYLSMGIVASMLFGNQIIHWYLNFYL